MPDRIPCQAPRAHTPPQPRAPTLLAAALLLSSCTLLPPSLRTAEAPKPAAAPPPASPAPGAPGQPPAPPPPPPASDVKLYPGSGAFLNQKPPKPALVPGPEEASLNFEALDIREVAKVILGDYMRQSYTVHPAVAGTVTFRTVRPISMKDLLH